MIFCCGEALIDMIPVGEGAEMAFCPHAGGAVFNTAIGLGRLGVPTGFISGISSDLFGQQLAEVLAASKVDTAHAITSDRPTTLAFVKLDQGHATYTFYDENTAGRSLTPDQVPSLPQAADAFFFGGISLISEPCADFYAALAAKASVAHVVMLDPNIRPGFITDAEAYRARLDRMIAVADIIKVSDQDLDWLVPEVPSLARQVSTLAPGKIVIVTRGSEGATAFLPGGGTVDAAADRVEVVDTVGAGDTFNAGVLASLRQAEVLSKDALAYVTPDQLQAALAYGSRIAAVTVSRAGANPPWASELS